MNSIQFIANTVDKHILHSKDEQSTITDSADDQFDAKREFNKNGFLLPQTGHHLIETDNTTGSIGLESDAEHIPSREVVSRSRSGSGSSSNGDDDNESIDFEKKSETEAESNEDYSIWRKSVYVVLFVPDNLIRKPLLFTWLIITYPFTYFFSLDPSNHNYQFTVHSTPNSNDMESSDPSRESGIRKQDLLSEEIKSPTSYSKYIIPPPKNLFPIHRHPPKKKTLILDLDETLIHSLSRGARMSTAHMVEIKINNMAALYFVHKRPYCDEFLKEVSKWYDVIIFTASVKEYADPVIDWLDNGENFFKRRYYREHCTFRKDAGYIKDLSIISSDLSSVIIIDNSPISYALHEDNAIMIEGWINDPSDADLLHLLPLLNSLRYTTDVRSILSLKNGEAAFEN